MLEAFARPERRVPLTFRDHDELAHAVEPVRSELSAIASSGACIWTANDELATVERLVRLPSGGYGHHRPFHLGDFFDLPEGPQGRMDIEGLDVDDGYLWVVGSHSLTREKPKPDEHDPIEMLAKLSAVQHHPNRHFLGRVPLVETSEPGVYDLSREARAADGSIRRAACIETGGEGSILDRLLRDDEHVGRFIGVPAKENGFDIEGIAAHGGRVFLGLRGPVLRGFAIVLELALEEAEPGRLEPNRIGVEGHRCAKHFLDLGGLGVRELEFDGDALLLLAGPTMDLDGPVTLFRWRNCLGSSEQIVVPAGEIENAMAVPFGRGTDQAEGMCWLGDEGPERELLMVYDPPAPDRRHDDGATVDADLFRLAGTAFEGSQRGKA